MKKIERKSRVLKLHREIVVHLTPDDLKQAGGASTNTACFGCHGSGTSSHTDADNQFDSKR